MIKKPLLFKISTADKIFFARNLALLLKSGISLNEALTTLENSTNSTSLKYLLNQLNEDIQRGQFLADSLSKFEKTIGKFFIATIEVGEKSGRLIDNLEKIAVELQKIAKLRSKVITTLIYPFFLILVMITIVILVVYFLFPKILPIFDNLKIDLPPITKIFIGSVKFFLKYGYYLGGGFIVFFLIFIFLLKNDKFKFYFHKFLISLPGISPLLKNYYLAEFSRNLAILLESGIPAVEALKLSGESSGNYVYKKSFINASEYFVKGHTLSEFLEKEKKLFPYQFAKMIAIGERTGNLTNILLYLTENYEEEVSISLERFVNLLEPTILILVASVVAFMALAIVLPIYEISDKLSK